MIVDGSMIVLKAFGIDCAADGCVISDNILLYNSPEYGGISVSGRNAVVERNQLRSMLKEAGSVRPIALLLARLGGNGSLGSVGGRLSGNLVLGVQEGIVVFGNEGAEVLDNRVESEGQEVGFGILLGASSRVRVQGNRITNSTLPVATSGGTANVLADNSLVRGGGLVEGLGQLLHLARQGDAGGVVACRLGGLAQAIAQAEGAEHHAACSAYAAPGIRSQLEAQAAEAASVVVGLVQQVPHLQPGLGLRGVQLGAQLAGGVVPHQLVVAAAAELLALDAAEIPARFHVCGLAAVDVGVIGDGRQLHLVESASFSAPATSQHLAFGVDDCQATVIELRDAGLEVSDPFDIGAGIQAFLRDPAGNLLEFNEPTT